MPKTTAKIHNQPLLNILLTPSKITVGIGNAFPRFSNKPAILGNTNVKIKLIVQMPTPTIRKGYAKAVFTFDKISLCLF